MPLPMLHFSAAGLSADEAFERWRTLIAPIYRIDHARGAGKPPMGEAIAYLCGDILFNRTIFEAQHVARDKKLVDATPDHVILQFWRSGGYNGEIADRSIAYGGGCVRIVDCRRVLGGRFTRSDTVGFTLPRRLVAGIRPDRVPTILDPRRNRLAAAKITSLYSRASLMEAADVPDVTADVLAFLRRLLDPSPAVDVLLGREFDESLLRLAERVIVSHIDNRVLTPDFVAERIGVSRATLYRIFAPVGGVMRHVAEQRLLAASRMLADPLERRSLVTLSRRSRLQQRGPVQPCVPGALRPAAARVAAAACGPPPQAQDPHSALEPMVVTPRRAGIGPAGLFRTVFSMMAERRRAARPPGPPFWPERNEARRPSSLSRLLARRAVSTYSGRQVRYTTHSRLSDRASARLTRGDVAF